MSFLPENYDLPKSASSYTKFDQGKTKIRIISNSIVGTLVWNNGKPYRFRQEEEVTVHPDRAGDKPRHFWAFVVYNYNSNQVEILEVTQKSLQLAIMDCYQNEDYGDPKGYDISITKTGEKMETKYTLIPSPPKIVSDEVLESKENKPVNLEAMYDGEDPFKV